MVQIIPNDEDHDFGTEVWVLKLPLARDPKKIKGMRLVIFGSLVLWTLIGTIVFLIFYFKGG